MSGTAIAFYLCQITYPLNDPMKKTEFLFRLKIKKLEKGLLSNSLTARALHIGEGPNIFNLAAVT